jgi:hypothetical protein
MPVKSFEEFMTFKTSLCREPVIAYARSDRTFSLVVDAAKELKKKKVD